MCSKNEKKLHTAGFDRLRCRVVPVANSMAGVLLTCTVPSVAAAATSAAAHNAFDWHAPICTANTRSLTYRKIEPDGLFVVVACGELELKWVRVAHKTLQFSPIAHFGVSCVCAASDVQVQRAVRRQLGSKYSKTKKNRKKEKNIVKPSKSDRTATYI